jgi:hypothetical protein
MGIEMTVLTEDNMTRVEKMLREDVRVTHQEIMDTINI